MAEIKKRTKKNGKISYTASIRIKGYPAMNATFDRLTDARSWASENEAKMRRGKHIKDVEAKKHTLAELIDRYIEFELPKRKSDRDKFKMQLEWWKNKIGAYLLSEITPSLLSKYKEVLASEPSAKAKKGNLLRSGATINRYMASLSIVLSIATKEWEWIEENPMLKVSKNKETRGRVRFLTDDEQNNLLNACKEMSNPLLYMLVVLALSTGARYGELINLKWENVKFDDKEKSVTLHFINTKNGDNRGVTIDSLGYDLLKQHSKVRMINSKYIFSRSDGKKPIDIRKQWQKALKKSGIEDFRFHDLRHTTASNLAMNGAGLRDIAEILGHKTLQMVQRYSHLTQKYTTNILKELNKKQFGGLNG